MINELESMPNQDSSYIMAKLRLVSYARMRNTDLAIQHAKEAVRMAVEGKHRKVEAQARNLLGICYGMQAQYETSIEMLEQAYKIAQEIDYPLMRGSAQMNLGIVFKQLYDFTSSITYFQRAWEIYDSLQSKENMARISNNLGNLFLRTENIEEATTFYRKAKNLYQEVNYQRGYASAQLNMGRLLLKSDKITLAEPVLDSALNYVVENHLETEEAIVLAALGELHLKKETYELANYYLVTALAKAQKLKLRETQVSALSNLATLHAKPGSFAQSLAFVRQAQSVADSLGTIGVLADVEELASSIYEKLGDAERALHHFKQKQIYEDSIATMQAEGRFQSMEIQFKLAQKNRAIETQALELDLLSHRLSFQTRLKWGLAILSLCLFIAGLLYYQKFRQRKIFSEELGKKNAFISNQKAQIDQKNNELQEQYRLRKETDEVINYFAQSLTDKSTEDQILWDVTKNCIAKLGFEDCVIYLLDKASNTLIQKAAYGVKNPQSEQIQNRLVIPVGQGIVGSVAESGIAEIVNDTATDTRYLPDLVAGRSELTIPIKHEDEVIGVLDSENQEVGFFTDFHLQALKTISAICASKILQVRADEKYREARAAELEAKKSRELDELKSQFFTNVSHEFRTPLQLILAPLMKEDHALSPDEVGLIRKNAKRLLRLVNQLLELTKIEVGLLKLELQPLEVYSFISELAQLFLPVARSRQIDYHIDIPERDYIALCDPDKLEKIIYNLLSNAFKFTSSGEKITIHIRNEDQQKIHVTVSDTGRGIPQSQLNKVFDRFYQGSSAGNVYAGTGIGLALTKDLVQLMQGQIYVDSEEGKGSIFTVSLPLPMVQGGDEDQVVHVKPGFTSIADEQINQDVAGAELIEPGTDVPLVLLAEDHGELRSYLVKEFTGMYQMVAAADGEEALSLAIQTVPDLIITDIMMPKMDGLTLIKSIRENDKTAHIPVVLLTAKDDDQTRTEGFRLGAVQFIAKPFSLPELQARIEGLFAQREKLRQKYQTLHLPVRDGSSSDRAADFLTAVVEIVDKNLENESFSVEHLQRAMAMSRMQLHRKLKALVNQSTSEFIRNIRLQRAAELLRLHKYQIGEVAYQVGFSHLSYFAKCFKERFGVLPSEFVRSG